MKRFFQLLLADRLDWIFWIATLALVTTSHWSTSNYVCWAIWHPAVAIQLSVFVIKFGSRIRWLRGMKLRRQQGEFWLGEMTRLYRELQEIPAWDQAAIEDNIRQFIAARRRYERELAPLP